MRVLWLCNMVPSMIAEKMNKEATVKEGWVTGTLQSILRDNHEARKNGENCPIELAIAYPVPDAKKEEHTEVSLYDYKIDCYSFYEDVRQPENYCTSMEPRFREILEDYKPDIVHAFGTEYPHTLAMARVLKGTDKLIIGLQGIISKCGEEYTADLPDEIVNGRTFRDIIRKDNIAQQQAKFLERGEFEKEAISLTKHVIGRTDFDRRSALELNSTVQYHYMGETMRDTFYSGTWDLSSCERHSLFVSQADYPLKGFHYLLEAMPEILEKYPDARIKVAGADIVSIDSMKDRLKLPSYGKYLRALMQTYGLHDKIDFLGKMNAEEMKLQFIRCHTFVCPSSLENSPNSVAEAMLLGVPVVAARVGGIPSILHEPEEGLLFEKGNSQGLAENILRIWDSDAVALEMSACEMQRARENYDREGNYRMLLNIYKRVSSLVECQ